MAFCLQGQFASSNDAFFYCFRFFVFSISCLSACIFAATLTSAVANIEDRGIVLARQDERNEAHMHQATNPTNLISFLRSTRNQEIVPLSSSSFSSSSLYHPYNLLQTESVDFGKPDSEQWLCRISYSNGPCDYRSENDIEAGRHCPPDHCCSKTACKDFKCLGGWCIKGGVLCAFKYAKKSSDSCTCKTHGHLCSPNAVCHGMNHTDGGTYCTCANGFTGNGRDCQLDPCYMNPCAPGLCSSRGSSYVCDCPENTHDLREITPDGKSEPSCEVKRNDCLSEPCGYSNIVDACVNFEDGYECICKDGYASEEGFCAKLDWCKSEPCGPREAVHQCVSNQAGYECICQRGYKLSLDDDGLEFCEKDRCADNPCGPAELVISCSNRGLRLRTEEEEVEKSAPYSCLCSELAELKIDPVSLEGRCVRSDPCKANPCGPKEAVAQCFVEGLSYGCICESGYTIQRSKDGSVQCVVGNPCELGACGEDPYVDDCTTDGKTYLCSCSSEGFLSTETNGLQICRSRLECEENCGPIDAVSRCTMREEGIYDCGCKTGYLLKYVRGRRICSEGDPCAVSPCGSAKAVSECRREGTGYTCICNRGYELRQTLNEKQFCAEAQACAGDPCGPSVAVELCLPGKVSYSCQCKEPYVNREKNGRERCVLPATADTLTSGSTTAVENKNGKTGEGSSTALIAGVALGGVALGFAALSGVNFLRKKKSESAEEWVADEPDDLVRNGGGMEGAGPAVGHFIEDNSQDQQYGFGITSRNVKPDSLAWK